MEQRLSLVTLAVRDLARATAFYQRLGWRRSVRAAQGVAFFQCGGMALSLYPAADQARDLGLPAEALAPPAGVVLAHNVRHREEVALVLAEAEAAGAEILRPAGEAAWGGWYGFFRDPEGHLWEVAWNPGFALDAAGNLALPA
jgi:catechol 2,3-dioxygenase-like lactoylglutathione lyase family enzyme